MRLRATTKAAVAVDRLAAIGVRRGAPAWTAGRPPRAACPPPFGHDRSADTKSPFGQHENACFAGCTKPSIPTFSRRPRSGRFRVARRGHSCPAVRRGPTGLNDGAAHTARRSLKP